MNQINPNSVTNSKTGYDELRDEILDYQRTIKTLTSALCKLELNEENRRIVTLLLDDLVNDLQKLTTLFIEKYHQ